MRECRILDTWSVSGMRGTGSNDCVFDDVRVQADFVCLA
jgi:alkylation response protein AidB-like acyl-CoA dehydrogenase